MRARRIIDPGAALVALVLAALPASQGHAQSVTLPMLSACTPDSAPALPTRWRAVGMMLPFVVQQIDVGEFIYDGTLPAMRATIYGLESGAVDLLITDKQTYRIFGTHDTPTGCAALGPIFSPPPKSWLTNDAVCTGQVPLANVPVQWWKTAAPDGRARWHWYKTDTRMPWRLLLPSPAPDPAVIGNYAMTYFPTFTALPETNLAKLRDFCSAHPANPGSGAPSNATSARALMAIRSAPAEAERLARIQTLIPGVSYGACSRMKPSRWPDQFLMTAVISPTHFNFTPLPSIIYYDWSGAATEVAVMYDARTLPPARRLLSALTKGVGYSIKPKRTGGMACIPEHPGIVRPDWMSASECQCKAVIDHNAALSPKDVSQILACPIKWQANRVNWTWYTTDGRPILFGEPGAQGTGVMLADYQQWMPGMKVGAEHFELPKECVDPGKSPAGADTKSFVDISCSGCHTAR